MGKRVQEEDIIQINEAYALCHVYSRVAEMTGWSASTVRKYVQKDYVPKENIISQMTFNISDIPVMNFKMFRNCGDLSSLFLLSNKEMEEVDRLHEEMII